MMPMHGRGDEGAQLHADQRRREIDQQERHHRHEPQEQQVAEGVGAEPLGDLGGERPGAAEKALRPQALRAIRKMKVAPMVAPTTVASAADQRAEQDAARDGEDQPRRGSTSADHHAHRAP